MHSFTCWAVWSIVIHLQCHASSTVHKCFSSRQMINVMYKPLDCIGRPSSVNAVLDTAELCDHAGHTCCMLSVKKHSPSHCSCMISVALCCSHTYTINDYQMQSYVILYTPLHGIHPILDSHATCSGLLYNIGKEGSFLLRTISQNVWCKCESVTDHWLSQMETFFLNQWATGPLWLAQFSHNYKEGMT